MAKVGRNQACPCGSGKKYKRCHGPYGGVPAPLPNPINVLANLNKKAAGQDAAEFIRLKQQGKGRPIVAGKVAGHQVVAVGEEVHWSSKWKTFADFLADYMKKKLGADWANAELAKSPTERHPLMQWAFTLGEYQKETIKKPGEVVSAPLNGVVACYLGTAYALYLLQHNVELQDRLLNRLKDIGQFQGAYYELFVASTLIRAGFTLALEDESDGSTKHCEFSASSQKTGKKYWVEAKMRSVEGMLGRTAADGGADAKPFARMIPHLNAALAKPASDERLIFIDLNTPPKMDKNGLPDWLETAMRRLEQFEKAENSTGASAYVFLTNIAYHRDLMGQPLFAASPFGLGLPDFNRPGIIRVSDAYRAKRKHADAHDIGHSIEEYLRFPTTFDGKLLSETSRGASAHPKIGETYFFPNVDGRDITGTVTEALVDEQKKTVILGISNDTEHLLLQAPMPDKDLAEWKEFGDAVFDKKPSVSGTHAKNELEMFEWFMEVCKDLPRDKIIANFATGSLDFDSMTDEDLRIVYCENLVAALPKKK